MLPAWQPEVAFRVLRTRSVAPPVPPVSLMPYHELPFNVTVGTKYNALLDCQLSWPATAAPGVPHVQFWQGTSAKLASVVSLSIGSLKVTRTDGVSISVVVWSVGSVDET